MHELPEESGARESFGCSVNDHRISMSVVSPKLPLPVLFDDVKFPNSPGEKPMSDGTSKEIRLAKSLGWDGKLVALSVSTVLSSVAIYSAWAIRTDLSLVETLNRFLSGFVAMLGFAVLAFPLIVPCMLIGWSAGWVAGGAIRLPVLARATIAAAVLGGSAVLPITYFFGRSGYAAENEWRVLVLPLLWIVPSSAILAAQIIFRRR